MLQHKATQCNTTLYGTIPYIIQHNTTSYTNTRQHTTTHDTMQYNALYKTHQNNTTYNSTQYNTTQHNTTLYQMRQCNTTQHNSTNNTLQHKTIYDTIQDNTNQRIRQYSTRSHRIHCSAVQGNTTQYTQNTPDYKNTPYIIHYSIQHETTQHNLYMYYTAIQPNKPRQRHATQYIL